MSTGMLCGVMGTIKMFELEKLRGRVEELERQLRWTSGYLQGSQSAQNAYPWQQSQQGIHNAMGQAGCWPGQSFGPTTTGNAIWTNYYARALMATPPDEGGSA